VRLWLLGLQRDRIADSLNVSAGTVSHTVSEWKDRLGAPLAEEVRDFCVIAKTQNMTPLQCAEGFMFLNQLKNCRLSLDKVTPFILEFYKMCVSGLDDNHNVKTKSKMLQAFRSLKEEFISSELTESMIKRLNFLKNNERHSSLYPIFRRNCFLLLPPAHFLYLSF
jgi:hypothetical protein